MKPGSYIKNVTERFISKNIQSAKFVIILCLIVMLSAITDIFMVREMKKTAEDMYEHPYKVTNTARAMRSRALEMKRFVGIVLSYNIKNVDTIHEFFQDRYATQKKALDVIFERYLGPINDVIALRDAMNELIVAQDKLIRFMDGRTEAEILEYLNKNIYYLYDIFDERLADIVEFSDSKIFSLLKNSVTASNYSIIRTLVFSFIVIFLIIYINRMERMNTAALRIREHELKDALLLAQKSSNAKRNFFSQMSHEIRTPMNVIIGMATIASAHITDRNRIEGCLSKIAFSSRHLLALINDMLDMAKIEEGKFSIIYEPFKLRQLIESVVSIIYPQAKEQGKIFTCNVEDVTQETYIGDFLRVNQILLNLLSNAVKFTPQGGTIRLEARQAAVKNGRAYFVFTVSDTGIGMSEEFMERLFRPFEQEDSTISRKYGGTGLGMAITHNLVGLLGGSIHVESKLGEGSTFTVKLTFEMPEEATHHKKWQLDALKVLIVDDEKDTCTHVSLLLKGMGINADWIESGPEAVRLVLEEHEAYRDYDVCLVDWQMPEMDGVEVTRRIRKEIGPDTLIIIISAYDWKVIEKEAREAGANAFISKPLFESDLYDVLLSVVTGGGISTAEKAQNEPAVDCTGKHFLLVEDNELNREIALELLNVTGAQIDCAENGEEAVERFLASPQGYYSLVLMDIQMPVMDGYEAARALRASARSDARTVPIYAMTANAFSEDVDNALNAGMNGHFAKPVDIKAVLQELSRIFKIS